MSRTLRGAAAQAAMSDTPEKSKIAVKEKEKETVSKVFFRPLEEGEEGCKAPAIVIHTTAWLTGNARAT